jgi:hypothetical protein
MIVKKRNCLSSSIEAGNSGGFSRSGFYTPVNFGWPNGLYNEKHRLIKRILWQEIWGFWRKGALVWERGERGE